jgi:hypothetical protein
MSFKLKSGNKTNFKSMGSSPLNKVNESGKWVKTKHQKKLIRNYDEHKNDPSYQKALTGAFGGKTTYDSKTGMVSIEKGTPDKSSSPATFKSSPAKTHKPGHKKGTSVSDFDKTLVDSKGKTSDAYEKRKEVLLNQGFTQKDADLMIKSGAVTGKTTSKTTKPANIKTIQNKKAKGGKLTKAEKRQLDEYRIHVTEQNK